LMTGAILIASGRVPKTDNTFIILPPLKSGFPCSYLKSRLCAAMA